MTSEAGWRFDPDTDGDSDSDRAVEAGRGLGRGTRYDARCGGM